MIRTINSRIYSGSAKYENTCAIAHAEQRTAKSWAGQNIATAWRWAANGGVAADISQQLGGNFSSTLHDCNLINAVNFVRFCGNYANDMNMRANPLAGAWNQFLVSLFEAIKSIFYAWHKYTKAFALKIAWWYKKKKR